MLTLNVSRQGQRQLTKELKTDKYQHHRPWGFMMNIVDPMHGSSDPFLYKEEDCMDVSSQKIIEV
jgi:hypothetical protein